eukprot:1197659-Rhodomonas_salina.1
MRAHTEHATGNFIASTRVATRYAACAPPPPPEIAQPGGAVDSQVRTGDGYDSTGDGYVSTGDGYVSTGVGVAGAEHSTESGPSYAMPVPDSVGRRGRKQQEERERRRNAAQQEEEKEEEEDKE